MARVIESAFVQVALRTNAQLEVIVEQMRELQERADGHRYFSMLGADEYGGIGRPYLRQSLSRGLDRSRIGDVLHRIRD